MSPRWLPHHALVEGAQRAPSALAVLHGILGSGANWRTFARRLTAARPDWSVVLVDLREHGQSQGAPPPHTLAAAAADVAALAGELGPSGLRVAAVAGHSFGGKVALELLGQGAARLDHVWTLDSPPGADPGALAPSLRTPSSPAGVLARLAALPADFARREDFVAALRAGGLSAQVADWLAMNLAPDGDRLRLRLDPAAIGELLADYHARDLWPVLERPPPGCAIHVVIAGRSTAWSAEDGLRAAALAAASGSITVEVLPESGHWVHVDALDALVDLVASRL